MRTRVELEKLGEEIAEHAAHIDAAMHTMLTKLREFDAGGGWYAQGARTCAHWCAWRIGWGLGMAREHLRVAKALASLPKTDEQLRTGKLSYSKARAITRVACPETEELLLHVAAYAPASALERLCQKHAMVKRLQNKRPYDVDLVRTVERRSLADGMMKIAAVLRPDEAAVVWKAIEQARKDVPAETPLRRGLADALVSICQAYLRGDQPERPPVEVIVTVPQESLRAITDEPAMTADGTCVSAETARRLSCDCAIVEVMEDEQGRPLSVGRKSRSIPAAIRRAMLHRDEHACRFPGCTARAHVEGHHIEHWATGGATELANLVTLCSYHHAFLHEHGFTIEVTDGAFKFLDPRGRVVLPAPPRVHRLLSAEMLWRQQQELAISAETNRSRWRGDPLDIDYMIGALSRREPSDLDVS